MKYSLSEWLYTAAYKLMWSAQFAYEDATELAQRDMMIGSYAIGAVGSAKEWTGHRLASIAMRLDQSTADENDGL